MFVQRHLDASKSLENGPGAILIETERLLLRRHAMSDAPGMAAAANHELVAQNMRDRFPSPYSLADAESFLRVVTAPSEFAYPEAIAILVKPGTPGNTTTEPLYIGSLGIMRQPDVYYRTWELGYWLTPSAWGKGYMTEAVRAFARWCFATWPMLNRLEAETYVRNKMSGKVLAKCGFIYEGTKRQNVEKKGELLDTMIYGLLRTDIEREDEKAGDAR